VAAQSDDKRRFPRLLICEGPEDGFFFHRLIQARGLPKFHIRVSGGNSQFSQAINKFKIENTKAFRALRDIVIVADNDEGPDDRFKNVCMHIERIFGRGTAPNNPQERTITNPRVSVLMVPWTNTRGHLERLCCDSARDADKTAGKDVDDFMAVCRAERWTDSRFGKAWLRTNLAIRCERDPFIPLGVVFEEVRNHHLIPVEHASFKQIANFLSSFA
jgi:hypothetical protein